MLSQSVKKGAKSYISNYYGPSNKRHQISFFVNDTCRDYQWHLCSRHTLYILLYAFHQICNRYISSKKGSGYWLWDWISIVFVCMGTNFGHGEITNTKCNLSPKRSRISSVIRYAWAQ